MKNLIKFGLIFSLGLLWIGCVSSDASVYSPLPSNGDYVVVDRMIINSTSGSWADTISVQYNRNIQPLSLTVKGTGEPSKSAKSELYRFAYSDTSKLSSIDIALDGSSTTTWRVEYDGVNVSKLVSDTDVVNYDYTNSSITKARDNNQVYSYEYNGFGDLVGVSGDGVDLSIAYNNGYGPFMNVSYNLFYAYIPGTEMLSLVQGAKRNIVSISNNRTGEVFDFKYDLDEFGYVKALSVSKEGKIEYRIALNTSIYRLPE